MRGGGGGPRAGGSCDGHMHRHARHPSGLPLPLGLQNIAGGVEAHPFEGGPRGVKVHSGGGPSRQDIRFFAEEVPKSSAVGRRLPLPMRSSAPLGHEPPGPGGRGGRGAGGAVGGGGGDMPGHDQRSVGPAASRGGGGLASSEIERACTGGALSRVRARPRDPPPRLPPRAAHPPCCIRPLRRLPRPPWSEDLDLPRANAQRGGREGRPPQLPLPPLRPSHLSPLPEEILLVPLRHAGGRAVTKVLGGPHGVGGGHARREAAPRVPQ
mmetsp:Transcript_50570/g.161783  ORF Transcript_50570/g.161783 Transcript_50570/m.161783 type:complete len:267 (-) Transcript_50570:195-995(-)